MVGGEVLTQCLDTRQGHVQGAFERMGKLKQDASQMWPQQGAAWPVLFRPFLDPPFIDMRALGVGEVAMDFERVAEPRPRRRLGCPSFDGIKRREAIERVIDLKGVEMRGVMRIFLSCSLEGVNILGLGGADVPVPVGAATAAENEAVGRKRRWVDGEDKGSSSSSGSRSSGSSSCCCCEGSGGTEKTHLLLEGRDGGAARGGI
jgi:hypothetical protein